MSLPFKLSKRHKYLTIYNWKRKGLIETDEFIDELYNRYIIATNCELCNKEFKTSQDREMDHSHTTFKFRNIVCNSCNQLKQDVKMRSDNTSGYRGIYKQKYKRSKQGFRWVFEVSINGKKKTIKTSTDLEFLKGWANQWKIDNNYLT